MELDRQSVERRDFPISRRGYDPAAVDAHLRALATAVEDLRETLEDSAGETLGSTAGTQVQSILEAAEATAADIERQATELALRTRQQAEQDAERTRSEAVARAQRHVQAVSQATAVLRERVESMDGEVSALVQSLRAGAGRLAADLGAVETNMGELYDAASGVAPATGAGVGDAAVGAGDALAADDPWPLDSEAPAPRARARREGTAVAPANGSERAGIPGIPHPSPTVPAEPAISDDDLDGARLIALNMALNGESREQADRYLAENFDLADRAKLLDEVYTAIEG